MGLVKDAVYELIKADDMRARELVAMGYSRTNINLLLQEGLIHKYGTGMNVFYSVNEYGEQANCAKAIEMDPIFKDLKLGLRMGYTDIVPRKGRVVKGAMHS